MTSKKSLEQIKNHLLGILEIDAPELIHHYETIFPIIEKDLDRLEELENENKELNNKNIALELWNDCYTKENAKLKKAIEILKNKKVNIFHIWGFDDYLQYKQYYFFDEEHTEEDMLNLEEFNFLKEVIFDENF